MLSPLIASEASTAHVWILGYWLTTETFVGGCTSVRLGFRGWRCNRVGSGRRFALQPEGTMDVDNISTVGGHSRLLLEGVVDVDGVSAVGGHSRVCSRHRPSLEVAARSRSCSVCVCHTYVTSLLRY